MNIEKSVKCFILLFSLLMFIYQTVVAIQKLTNPPVVDSTERYNIGDMDSLLITICPLNQWNVTKLNQFGYEDEYSLLAGLSRDSRLLGWGAQHNLSFPELLERVNNFHLTDPVISWIKQDYSHEEIAYNQKFYPKYGWCFDLINFPKESNIFMSIGLNSKEDQSIKGEVFITDKNLKTRHTVHAASHWGSSINIEQGTENMYLIKLEKISNFDPRNPDDCRNYEDDDFIKCVDDAMELAWKPLFNCNPPWISSSNLCGSELDIKKEAINTVLDSSAFKTLNDIYNMRNEPVKESCNKSCTVMQALILPNGKKDSIFAKAENATWLTFIFGNEVIYTTKKLAYGSSEFLIDMGSSLGLWFGLSVFGITDLGIMALQYIQKLGIMVIRKFLM